MTGIVSNPPPEWGPEGFLSEAGQEWIKKGLIRSGCCGRYITGMPPRCEGCGHLASLGSHRTRSLFLMPPWQWKRELAARSRARKADDTGLIAP